MKYDPLVIGELVAKVPLIQGGMGVGVSLSGLAGAVAKEGGVGIISTAQIGFREPDYEKKPLEANLRAVKSEIIKAKEIAGGEGIIGVNIMVATRYYEKYVEAACEAGVDLIISGAGLPTELPELVKGYNVKIAAGYQMLPVHQRLSGKRYSVLHYKSTCEFRKRKCG